METKMAVIDDKKLATKEADAMNFATALVISDNETYTKADQFCVALKGLEKEIIGDFAESKSAASLAHKTICAQEKAHLDKCVPPRTLIKQKMSAYADAQEQLRREEEDRQRIEAQKRADDEALEAAQLAQAAGRTEEAAALLESPAPAVTVFVPKTTPKASTVLRKIWAFRVVNANLVPRQYLMIDEPALRKQAAATGNAVQVPGIEFYQKAI